MMTKKQDAALRMVAAQKQYEQVLADNQALYDFLASFQERAEQMQVLGTYYHGAWLEDRDLLVNAGQTDLAVLGEDQIYLALMNRHELLGVLARYAIDELVPRALDEIVLEENQ